MVRWIGRRTHRGNDPSRRHTGQEHVGWYLSNNIADRIDGRAGHKLIAVHREVFLHAAEKGIIDIVQIKILEKVTELST